MPPSPSVNPTTWTTRTLLDWMAGAFKAKGLESPKLSAEMLLAHVLGCDRLRLYIESDRPATPIERSALRDLVGRALNHEPVQYLVGEAWFFSLPFKVTPAVLIPRGCTEIIAEHVVQHARATPGFDSPTIADVCTGSGCLAVALAKQLKNARVIATDVSGAALAVARENAQRHCVADRVEFIEGDLLEPLMEHPSGSRLHYLLANPPYIPDSEWDDPEMMGKNVKGHEPELALRAGADALRLVRPLIEHGPGRLVGGGVMMIELAASSARDALALAEAQPELDSRRIVTDLDGLPRTLIARRRS